MPKGHRTRPRLTAPIPHWELGVSPNALPRISISAFISRDTQNVNANSINITSVAFLSLTFHPSIVCNISIKVNLILTLDVN